MNKSNVKIGFVSLGCAKNLIDCEVMLHYVADAGYQITPEETEADIVIINTCAFIESAKRESIDSILDIAWLKANKDLKGIIVTGCMAERYRDEVLKELPEIDALLGLGSNAKIVEAIESILNGESGFTAFDDKEAAPIGGERIVTTGEGMAYIKIAEGCSNRCTYCAIPLIRGKLRSRTIEDIVAEAKELDSIGIKELCVIAQDTSAYGIDIYGHYALPTLLREITKNTSIPWIRLLYCYPDKITDELIAEIRDNDRIVKYIDIPIQHISDRMLSAMNRHGDSAVIKDAVRRLRKEIPSVVLRTTAIVGFPGETDDDFTELCEFIKETKFERFGAFTYSREEDTPAYDMPDQIDAQLAQDRYDIIMQLQLTNSEEFNASRIGQTMTVLCESFDPVGETYYGRSAADAPDIDGKVYFTASRKYEAGEFANVKITEALDYDLVGTAI